jgi:hypothetical protein
MRNEPDIIKELREEERLGKLDSKIRHSRNEFDFSEHSYMDQQKGQGNEDATARGNTIQVSIDYEQRLLAAEERYEKIFRLSPDAIALLDKNGVFLDINERLYDWLGFRPDEIIGKTFLEVPFLTVDEKIKAKNKFLSRILGKEVPSYELEFLTKNEEKRIGLVRGTSIKNEWGNIIQSLVMISDITERKRAEETLKEVAAIVESSDDAIIGKTLEGIITSWNPGAEQIYGYSKQEIIGRPISLLLPSGPPNDIMDLLERIKLGERINHYEAVRRKKNGQCITVSLTISPIKDDTGKIVGASTIARDVTERKTLKQELIIKEQVLDLITDSIFLYDFEGSLLYANKTAYLSRGYTKEEMMGMNIHDLDALNYKTVDGPRIKTLQEIGDNTFESAHITKNGTLLPLEICSRIIDFGDKKLILSITHDITERKKAQEQLTDLQKKLDQKNKQRPVSSKKRRQ